MVTEAGLKSKVKIALAAAAVGAAGLLAYEVFHWATHVYESDVRVHTDFTRIASRIDGRIETVHVPEGAGVGRGQLLVTMERDDVQLEIAALSTERDLETGNRKRLGIEKAAFETDLRAKQATQREKIIALETELGSLGGRLTLARKDLARVRVLVSKRLRPESQMTVEQDKILVLEGRAAVMRGQIAVARRELDQLLSNETELAVFDSNIALSLVKEQRIEDEIRKRELALRQRHITSPIDGVVGEILRFKGEYVEDGVPILTLHDPAHYWIEAHVDEGNIRHVRNGQEVLIALDAYPFRDFYGTVRRIGSMTTGSADTGVGAGNRRLGNRSERVPVRISIDNPPRNITPGMRGAVNIRIYESIRLWSRD